MSDNIFARIRNTCALVVKRARSVRIDDDALGAFSVEIGNASPPSHDPAHHFAGQPDEKLAFILTLDAINFGSGYFPQLAKRPGLSGYLSLATSLKEHFEARGAWDAGQLEALSRDDCARVLNQNLRIPAVAELMGLFARALNDLGKFLWAGFHGEPANLIAAADRSAARLVEILAEMPFYRDVSRYDGIEVPFYKRAQITSADLSTAFGRTGYGEFADLDQLTLFADNLVPHVLRCAGVLIYDAHLARRIDAGELLEAGSHEEIEIRASALHAVERCVEKLQESGIETTARQLDALLWTRGQLPEIKAHPRHRARTTYY